MGAREVTTWTRAAGGDPPPGPEGSEGSPGRAPADDLDDLLARAGLAVGDDGPLVAMVDGDVEPGEVATVLGAWIAALRDAMRRAVDVVTILPDDHLDGDDVGRLSVGHGVVAGSRSYGFEGQRDGLVANVVVGPLGVALDTAAWVLGSGSLSGQVLLVGDAHHGRQRP